MNAPIGTERCLRPDPESGANSFRLLRHRLRFEDGTAVPYVVSPNRGGRLQPRYLVMHYTAGGSVAGTVGTLTDPNSRASAHIVIGRDGDVTQLVPFNRIAWHAGHSRWHGLRGLNAYSIGIELDNAGRLERQGNEWRSWFGRTYPRAEVTEATHKNESRLTGWHVFAPAQIEAAIHIGRLLATHYKLRDVLGHDDISPGRKSDPGPAFPMTSFRSAVMGREWDGIENFETVTRLNIRRGPGADFEKLAASPLAPGTRLTIEMRQGNWCQVEVLGDDDLPSETGWVHGDYIRLK